MRKRPLGMSRKKCLVHIAVIVVALVMLFFPITNRFLTGMFGVAIYAYLPSFLLLNILLFSGRVITLSRAKIAIYVGVLLSFVSFLHLIFAKSLIETGLATYILDPFVIDTVGGFWISLLTSIILLILDYKFTLIAVLLITATLALLAVFPLLEEKPAKKHKGTSKIKVNPLKRKVDEEDLDDEPNTKETHIDDRYLKYKPLNKESNVLFGSLLPEEERQFQESKNSIEILFDNKNPKSNDKSLDYSKVFNYTERTSTDKQPKYSNADRDRLFNYDLEKDFVSRYGDGEKASPILNFDEVTAEKAYPNSGYKSDYNSNTKEDVPNQTTYHQSDYNYKAASFPSAKEQSIGKVYSDLNGYENSKIGEATKDKIIEKVTFKSPNATNTDNGARSSYGNSTKAPPVATNRILTEDVNKHQTRKAYKYIVPPMDLLPSYVVSSSDDVEDYQHFKTVIEETYRQFRTEVEVFNAIKGPAFTRFEMRLGDGVSVSNVKNRNEDLAMKLEQKKVRILAPIVGKNACGVEVPNKKIEIVGLKSVLMAKDYNLPNTGIQIALGKNLEGKTCVCDLDKLPHLLVGGSTGSGKSVFINALIMSILYKQSPDKVKLVLIDPKGVELSVYAGLPHLLLPKPIVDFQKATSMLNWLTKEMDRRYDVLTENKVRNIDEYNRLMVTNGTETMYRIILIIDEVADIMMQSNGSVERPINRLAFKARAAGIHVILATQRPTVSVITGNIKANIIARISFAVQSSLDSRVILDSSGAEELIGKGDMIYDFNMQRERLQSPFIDTDDVNKVVEFIKNNNVSEYDESIQAEIEAMTKDEDKTQTVSSVSNEIVAERDLELEIKALSEFIDIGKASATAAQSLFGLGYPKANRIINNLERKGFISKSDGSKPRDVLIDRQRFNELFENKKE